MDNYLDNGFLIGFEVSTISNGCIQGGGRGMATMLMKSKALAQKTHRSSSVANQALKDKCIRLGFKFPKPLTNMESNPSRAKETLSMHSWHS